MNITGILVQAKPVDCTEVKQRLLQLPGVEVHSTDSLGRIITTVEDTNNSSSTDTINKLHDIKGIICATLVYHFFEPEQLSGDNP